MPGSRQPTAFVFCIADHPVFSALLTVCRDVAASGRGLRSADDYRRWWFVVTATVNKRALALPPDDPSLDGEDFIPGFNSGIVKLLVSLDRFTELDPLEGGVTASHALLTGEPLMDWLRDRGFDVLRPADLLAYDVNRPISRNNDAFDYERAITDVLVDEDLRDDDRIAFDYVLGRLDELPPTLAPSEVFFESLPPQPHPSDWIVHDHRVFDVLCRAGAFEWISFHSYETRWADSIHARAEQLRRRNVSPLEAFRGVLGRERTLAEDLELVAASTQLLGSWSADPNDLQREIAQAKRSLVSHMRRLVFDDLGEVLDVGAPAVEAAAAVQPRPTSNTEQVRRAFEYGSYCLRSAWTHGDLLLAVGYPGFVLRSTDAGDTWAVVELPLAKPWRIAGAQLDDGRVLIVAVESSGVAFSWDRGETWTRSRTGSGFSAVAVALDGRVCVVGRRVWAVSNDPTELPVHDHLLGLEHVTFDGERFVAVSLDGKVHAHDQDEWRGLATSMDAVPRAVAVRDDLMMVLAREGVATSEDGGHSFRWMALDRLGWAVGVRRFRRARAAAIADDGTRYLVAGRVLASDDGERWRVVPVGDNFDAQDIAFTKRAAVITSSRSIALVGPDSSTALCFGLDPFAECPEHYTVAEHAFAPASLPNAGLITALFTEGDRVVLGYHEELLLSEDRGRSFVAAVAPLRSRTVRTIVGHDGELWAACGGVLRSSDGGHSWVTVEAPRITKLLATLDGELFAVRDQWLLRYDPQARSGWRVCRRFQQQIDLLVSDESGSIYVTADDLYTSYDGGESWEPSGFEAHIHSVVPTAAGLLVCDGERLHVSHDHGRRFESHPLPLHVESNGPGQVHTFCCDAAGNQLYFSSEHFLLHGSDRGRPLARVHTPYLRRVWARRVVELWGRQYLLLDPQGLLERVDASEVPEPRFIAVEVG